MSEYIVGTDDHEGHWLTGEEIVRCRDCKWYDYKTEICERRYYQVVDVEPDGFCSWGVRRDA